MKQQTHILPGVCVYIPLPISINFHLKGININLDALDSHVAILELIFSHCAKKDTSVHTASISEAHDKQTND